MTESLPPVRAWAESVTIPSYAVGPADKNPMFLEKRVYQGSSGVVYPHPVIDCVFDERVDKTYLALWLENRYLKVMILPELGGRVQLALDKTNGYPFVYYNRVIKPALVGLAGPWISGGIEFNWPQHHRPSTFDALEWRIVEHDDGSRTVWCSEVERMFFTKGMHGFTLYPDRASLDISVQLYNRTSEPQTFLWWANPAVHVNDDYQSVFPPDVRAVMDHGKRDVSDFPIATGMYYKVNYAPGTDISRYKNIPVPTSYMAAHSDYDFLGDYDHGRQAGMLHIANHHLVPGKKQWTWGNGDFGRAWDRHLTDEDGPYIELMCGAFTDNQPDFSWLMPGEEKRFTQTFMPYQRIGPASNASRDAVISLQFAGDTARLGVYVTRPRVVRVTLGCQGATLWEQAADLSPEKVLIESVALPAAAPPHEVTLRVVDGATGRELVSYTPLPPAPPSPRIRGDGGAEGDAPLPSPATAARPPGEIQSTEELFLNGLHLEQYRHATYAPEPYYEEALRRDPLDSRCNNALGLLLYRRGKFADAEPYFRRAVASLTRRNPNPYDGEPYYNLGLALKMQGRDREAVDAFYKAAWNAAWQDAAFFELAQLTAKAADFEEALALARSALRRNGAHHQARHLEIALLRRLGRDDEAWRVSDVALDLDPMDLGVMWERLRLRGDDLFARVARHDAPTLTDLALDYLRAGLYGEALDLLQAAPPSDPLTGYYVAYTLLQQGGEAAARDAFQLAAATAPDYGFPQRLESVPVLAAAMRLNPADAHAPYYLGNFWYAHRRPAEAIAAWERARTLDSTFPTVWRNLGLAYANKRYDLDRAWDAYQRAFALDPTDARVLFELDQLAKRRNESPAARLARLERYPALVDRRDDLTVERITLLNTVGRHEAAYAVLLGRRFHPWEGGEGKVTAQYVVSLVEQALAHLAEGQPAEAVPLLEQAQTYPDNLGEGKLPNAQENNILYYLGLAYRALGREAEAQASLERAATGLSEPTSALYYNDQPPEMIYYQGMAQRALGREAGAERVFRRLVEYGQTHLDDDVHMDYFAVSLPTFLVFDEDLNQRNRIHCHTIMALGYLGLGQVADADAHFAAALTLDANHQSTLLHRAVAEV